METFANANFAGSFVADLGYISPGPAYTSFDVAGFLIDGINEVSFSTSATTGDYVIGQVDLHYSAVPIPAAVWLFGSALAGLGWMRRKQTN